MYPVRSFYIPILSHYSGNPILIYIYIYTYPHTHTFVPVSSLVSLTQSSALMFWTILCWIYIHQGMVEAYPLVIEHSHGKLRMCK